MKIPTREVTPHERNGGQGSSESQTFLHKGDHRRIFKLNQRRKTGAQAWVHLKHQCNASASVESGEASSCPNLNRRVHGREAPVVDDSFIVPREIIASELHWRTRL